MDSFDLGAQARATLAWVASDRYPELAEFFPFRGAVRFKTYFAEDRSLSIAITDDGALGQAVFVGGDAKADDPEIAEVLRAVIASRPDLSFNTLFAVLGENYFNFKRFTYAGPYRGGNVDHEAFATFLIGWMHRCVLPPLLDRNRKRVMRALPMGMPFDTATIGHSVVVLESVSGDEQGTAFMLDGVGFVTCQHCVTRPMRAFLSADRGKMFDVVVLRENETIDLAVLDIPGLTVPGLQRGDSDSVQQLDQLLVVGFPNHRFQDSAFSSPGNVVGFRMRSGIRCFVTNAAIVSGISGGPVLNSASEVIGVAVTGSDLFATAKETEDHSIIPIAAIDYTSLSTR